MYRLKSTEMWSKSLFTIGEEVLLALEVIRHADVSQRKIMSLLIFLPQSHPPEASDDLSVDGEDTEGTSSIGDPYNSDRLLAVVGPLHQ